LEGGSGDSPRLCLYRHLQKNLAIHWFQFEGYSTEQVAKGLNFNDNTNFRRSFKRWAGVTPAMCLKQLVVGD